MLTANGWMLFKDAIADNAFKKSLSVFKKSIDLVEAYTYNKSTVWFLSTPIQNYSVHHER
jgi:hypothetical protein